MRAVTELDRPNCQSISIVESGPWDDILALRTLDGAFEDAFNEARNAVANVGGNAYSIAAGGAVADYIALEAWHCNFKFGKEPKFPRTTSAPREVDAAHRLDCHFIGTMTEASNWGITGNRNTRNARRDVLKRVQDSGGDSYFLVISYSAPDLTAFIIVEALRCNFEGS